MCFGKTSAERPGAKDVAAHVASDVLKNIRLERHIHVYGPNHKTGLPFEHVKHSWNKFWRSFWKEHQWYLDSTVQCGVATYLGNVPIFSPLLSL